MKNIKKLNISLPPGVTLPSNQQRCAQNIVKILTVMVTALLETKPAGILEKLNNLLVLAKEPLVNNLLSHDALVPYWRSLITPHSMILTNLGLAYGKQIPQPGLSPLSQLLGIYSFALALKALREDKPALEAKWTSQAVAYGSLPALCGLLRFACVKTGPHSKQVNILALEKIIHSLAKIHLTPGCLVAAELWDYSARGLIGQDDDPAIAASIRFCLNKAYAYACLAEQCEAYSHVQRENAAWTKHMGLMENLPPSRTSKDYQRVINEICQRRTGLGVNIAAGRAWAAQESKLLGDFKMCVDSKAELVSEKDLPDTLNKILRDFSLEKLRGLEIALPALLLQCQGLLFSAPKPHVKTGNTGVDTPAKSGIAVDFRS